jgi:hypothetical protein
LQAACFSRASGNIVPAESKLTHGAATPTSPAA